ncbi:DUF6881 domain-containing protein [Streptomyces sp. NPDC001922]|uniref:DUF6881 domain-containing protein n=1 Tax=Streptomyces sp. NPDC001922 TaxID=3364624 RepID=UPI0036C0326F
MQYWRVRWTHDFDVEPVTLYNEIGDDGYEVRKVQEYRDGRLLKADASHECADIGLGEIPVGPIEDVRAQPEFSADVIDRAAFEEAWRRARYGNGR